MLPKIKKTIIDVGNEAEKAGKSGQIIKDKLVIEGGLLRDFGQNKKFNWSKT